MNISIRSLFITFLTYIAFASSISGQSSKVLDKIDSDYFNSLKVLDSNNIYIIEDIINIDYVYMGTSNTSGAEDHDFKSNLERSIRIRINKIKNLDSINVTFQLLNSNIRDGKVKINNVNLYYIEGERLRKEKFKKAEIYIVADTILMLKDFKNILIKDNSVVQINFKVIGIPKDLLRFEFDNQYFITNRIVQIRIPGIYKYDFSYQCPKCYGVQETTRKAESQFIGYRAGDDLIPESWYKNYKAGGLKLNFPKAYCNYYIHEYSFRNIQNSNSDATMNTFEMDLNKLNPIKRKF